MTLPGGWMNTCADTKKCVSKGDEMMEIRPFLFLLLVGLAGCQAGEPLAECKGPAFALNPGHWTPTAADIKACSPAVKGRQTNGVAK